MLQCFIIPPESDFNFNTMLIALFLFYLKLTFIFYNIIFYVGL